MRLETRLSDWAGSGEQFGGLRIPSWSMGHVTK